MLPQPSSAGRDIPQVRFPPTMPVSNEFHLIKPIRSEKVTPIQLASWTKNPETIQNFAFRIMLGDEEEIFKLVAFLISGKERVFYVQYVNDDEAIGFSNDAFFNLLKDSEQIV
ncbi:hypothetical protein GYMLUDRAFT_912437 [Collybiopsis luxurians FD-317 M1]|nr:hypothetical protein GYMLUDRAFT_912437 [Collybiopsis luxurians FD-317 M1]